MIPKIQLNTNKDFYTAKEVKQITDEITEAFNEILMTEISKFKFAKIISYLSLSVAIIVLAKEVFFK